MMDKKDKLAMLQKLSEKELTQRFLIPLYESKGMACKNVRYTHRPLEFGKDIIYCKDDEHGSCIYTGIQVKKTKIATGNLDNIIRQINEAFGEPFTDLTDGKKKDLDRFVVLTSNEFLEDAKDSLWASLKGASLDKRVTCIDGNRLVALLTKHLPSALWDEYDHFSKYFNAMKSEFETIKDISAIGQKEPVPLEDIYVSLRVVEPDKSGEMEIFSEQQTKFNKREYLGIDKETRLRKGKIFDAEKAIKDFHKLVIVGAPGSGKTTLLRHLLLKSCKENLDKQEKVGVPILINLRQLSESRKGLRDYIDEVFERYRFPKAKEFIEKDLKQGNCQLLLDGFDELADKERQNNIAKKIQAFVKKYKKNRIVVTSRIAGYHDELSGFQKLELLEFDDSQMERFIENWFGKTRLEKAKSLSDAIKKNGSIKALARNPLLIAIIAVICEEDKELPQKRADLYKRCIDVLLSRWDVQKRLKNRYDSDKKEFILKKLAFLAHSNNKRILSGKEIIEEIRTYLAQMQLKKSDIEPFLDEIWTRSHLIRQIAMNKYDFLHLSFQEYFTALELKEQVDGMTVIIKHLSDPWWDEPVILYAGISKDASALIKKIKEEVPEDMFYSNLMLFGKCIADADFTEPALRQEIVNAIWTLYLTTNFQLLKEKAIHILALIKPNNIIDSLIKHLTIKKDNALINGVITILGNIGSEKAIEPLIKTFTTDKEKSVRATAVSMLGKIGSEKAIEPLIKACITDKDRDVRYWAAIALGRIGSEKAIEPLIKVYTTAKENDSRIAAAIALGRIGSEKAIEPLIKVLTTDIDKDIRREAVMALGSIGSEKAIEPLIKILTTHKDRDVRYWAVMALGRIGSEKAVEHLIKALTTDKGKDILLGVAHAIRYTGSEKAIEPLIKILTTNKEEDIRVCAALALGFIGSEKATESLIKILTTHKEKVIRVNAAAALGNIGSEKAIEPLIKTFTTDKEKSVRATAVSMLGKIGSEKAIEPLIKILTTHEEKEVRARAATALGEIGNEHTIQPLKAAFKDKSKIVRNRAFESLEKISRRAKKRILLA